MNVLTVVTYGLFLPVGTIFVLVAEQPEKNFTIGDIGTTKSFAKRLIEISKKTLNTIKDILLTR